MSPTFWLPSIQDHGGFGSFKIKAPFQGEAALVIWKSFLWVEMKGQRSLTPWPAIEYESSFELEKDSWI